MDWINVEDKLPIDNKMTLCFMGTCNVKMMYHKQEGVFLKPWANKKEDVTHWMPLPKSP